MKNKRWTIWLTCTLVAVLMVAGLGCMDAGLGVLAAKLKKKSAIVLLVISFVCSLCMGYLSSQDFTQSFMNWMAQGINVVGQGTLLAAVWMLHKAGLKDLSWDK